MPIIVCEKTTLKHQEMNYIKYEVNFLPLFYVQNIKISVHIENLYNFNFSFWEYMYRGKGGLNPFWSRLFFLLQRISYDQYTAAIWDKLIITFLSWQVNNNSLAKSIYPSHTTLSVSQCIYVCVSIYAHRVGIYTYTVIPCRYTPKRRQPN